MEIIEALNIVSDFIDGEYQYQDDEGQWWAKSEAVKAMQILINYGMVQHLAEWYRFYARWMIDNEVVYPPVKDPNFIRSSVTH